MSSISADGCCLLTLSSVFGDLTKLVRSNRKTSPEQAQTQKTWLQQGEFVYNSYLSCTHAICPDNPSNCKTTSPVVTSTMPMAPFLSGTTK